MHRHRAATGLRADAQTSMIGTDGALLAPPRGEAGPMLDDLAPKTGIDDSPAQFWPQLREEAAVTVAREPLLVAVMGPAILDLPSFEAALIDRLAAAIPAPALPQSTVSGLLREAYADEPNLVRMAVSDLIASRNRNAAYRDHLDPFLYSKGFRAVEFQRLTHWLWRRGRLELATFLHAQACDALSVDIHPAARLGRALFVDHATGLVIGETAVVGDDVSLLHEVTLGGTGKESGDRHPKLGNGVLVGAGAKILGNIRIGDGAKIGAGSVVLREVPPGCTAAGVPARLMGCCEPAPSLTMDHALPDE